MFTVLVTDQPEEETPITSRMPNDLIKEIQGIAKETSRSRSKAIVLLLKRGIEAYRQDGILGDTRAFPKAAEAKITDKKTGSSFAVLPGDRSLIDVADMIRMKAGMTMESFKLEYLVFYHSKSKKERYEALPSYIKGLIEAYYQGRLDNYISETQAPKEEAGYGS